MRRVKLLTISVLALFAFTAIAQANYGLKVNGAGARLEPPIPATALIKITAPGSAELCKWTESKGEVEKTNAPEVEVGFDKEYVKAEECGGGSEKVGFTAVRVFSLFGTATAFLSEKPYAKVRLGSSTCIYNIVSLATGALEPPTAFAATVTGNGKKHSGNASCAEEVTFTALASVKDPGNGNEPFELVEY